MIGKELLKIRYYFELNGSRVATRYGYFYSEEEAKDFYTKNIEKLKKDYGESVTDFSLIKEEILARRKLICRLSYIKYIVGCDSDIGEFYIGILDKSDLPYLTLIKSDVVANNYFYTKEEAEYMMKIYKNQLKPYYKDTILDSIKVMKVEGM